MNGNLTPPGGLDGEVLAVLVLFSFHCRVQLPDDASRMRKALLLFLTDKVYQVGDRYITVLHVVLADRQVSLHLKQQERPPAGSLQDFADELKEALGEDPDECKIVLDYLDNMVSASAWLAKSLDIDPCLLHVAQSPRCP